MRLMPWGLQCLLFFRTLRLPREESHVGTEKTTGIRDGRLPVALHTSQLAWCVSELTLGNPVPARPPADNRQ